MRQPISKTMANRIALKNAVHGMGRRCAIGSAYIGVAGGESMVADKKQKIQQPGPVLLICRARF